MWWYFLGIIGELIILSYLSKRLTQLTYEVFRYFTRSRSAAISIMTLLLFPGTVVHELSHLFTAEILGVRTGKLTLVPESIDTEEIQSGSVAIAQTGPLRRTLIGTAPMTTGIIIVTIFSYFLPGWMDNAMFVTEMGSIVSWQLIQVILTIYSIFVVSNTMFASKEDMKGVIPFLSAVIVIMIAIYVAGFRIGLPPMVGETISVIAQTLVRSLGIVIIVNLVFMLINVFIVFLQQKKR